ncbi:MAG: ribonuclease J [Maricaulaceae bacterium]
MLSPKNELVFLPLGGCGEIGMNLNLFGYGPPSKRKWIIVDIGVTFGGLDTPGVEIIMPDTDFIEKNVDDLLGIVLTHAHEDHMGALARLWPRLKCPVYATPFTMYLVKDRLAEFELLDDVELHEIPLKGRFDLGPFDIEMITLTHSIPEPNALAIRTDAGTILHTGDWKIDRDPQIGEPADEAAIRALSEEGILAMICDSTNVFSPGEAGSEGDVRKELSKLISEYEGRGVAVASFASNVARLESVMVAAKDNNRSVCLVGRSMERMTRAAKSVGLLSGLPPTLDQEEAAQISAEHVLYLCTGSQGEPRAALSRIANNSHRHVSFKAGDAVIFSSKIIPGNDKSIFALQNALADDGIEIVTEKSRDIHVSGHPCRDELTAMYEWAKPHIAIPVHGERRHLIEHAKLARGLGVSHGIAPHNGEMIKISKSGVDIVDIVENGRLHVDGSEIVSSQDDGLRLRRKMAYAGHVAVSIVTDKKGQIISGPETRITGFPAGHQNELVDDLSERVSDIAEDAFDTLTRKERTDEDMIETRIRSHVKRYIKQQTGKRTLVEVLAHRV